MDLTFLGNVGNSAPQPFYFNPYGFALLVIAPVAKWLQDYLKDSGIHKEYFRPDTVLLRYTPCCTTVAFGTTI